MRNITFNHIVTHIFHSTVFTLFVLGMLMETRAEASTVAHPPLQRHQTTLQQLLHDGWRVRSTTSSTFATYLPAQVPGCVHLDLLAAKRIPDPFFGDNEQAVQWIEDETWEYTTTFVCAASVLAAQHCDLVFEGLDTYAMVYVNDELLVEADNMFRTWRLDCKRLVRHGENRLRVVFAPAKRRALEAAQKLPFTLPGDEKVFTRKAQYHFGWDWGPRFVTCGIWRAVRLEVWNDARLRSVHIVQKTLTDKRAELVAVCEVESSIETKAEQDVVLRVSEQKKQKQKQEQKQKQKQPPPPLVSRRVRLQRGTNRIEIPFEIHNPRRWWSRGLGEAFLYNLNCELLSGSQAQPTLLDSSTTRIGLRTVEIVQRKDEKGKQFTIQLNGVPVFMRGANYIPADSFLPRVSGERLESLIKNAAAVGMNMLRVWGGGVYESDRFYDLCDEHGILVWQDFMFACAMYPGDEAFVENIRREATDNVKRLRNHPCIALWCGNNEINEGWNNWGWQKQLKYSERDSATIWGWYERVFRDVLPSVVREFDTGRFYWESSPQHGWGRKESLLEGDAHYWGVWWGLELFEMYNAKVGRFMSEYGFQALPDFATIQAFTRPEDRLLTSNAMKTHQKHPTGYETIQTYLSREYKQPSGLEQHSYVSQLLQARGIGTAIEAHRRAKPYCMGTLYWQLNDCWHVTSWSSIDYEGRWKALHYKLRDLYANVLLSAMEERDTLKVYLISDEITTLKGSLRLCLRSFAGDTLWSERVQASVSANSSTVAHRIPFAALKSAAGATFPAACVLEMQLVSNEKAVSNDKAVSENILAEKLHYFTIPKNLALSKPHLSFDVRRVSDEELECVVSTDVIAKDVFLRLPATTLSKNFFDVLPHKPVVVRLRTKLPAEEIRTRLGTHSCTMSLYDVGGE